MSGRLTDDDLDATLPLPKGLQVNSNAVLKWLFSPGWKKYTCPSCGRSGHCIGRVPIVCTCMATFDPMEEG